MSGFHGKKDNRYKNNNILKNKNRCTNFTKLLVVFLLTFSIFHYKIPKSVCPYRAPTFSYNQSINLFIIASSVSLSYDHMKNIHLSLILKLGHNKAMHLTTGNRYKGHSIALCHWNKGSSLFINKINELNILINENKPDIFSVSEANYQLINPQIPNELSNFYIEANKMSPKSTFSRQILLINKSLQYKRRTDLESDLLSTVWIEVSLPKSKPILIMGGYRQWQLPSELGFNKSKSIKHQKERYELILKNWKKASHENKDIIILMDDNIDTIRNSNHNNKFKINDIYDILQDHLNFRNFSLHNKKATRFAQHNQPSCIDHIFSNCPTKITQVQTYRNIFSDHCLLKTSYKVKANPFSPKYVKVSDRKKLTKDALEKCFDQSIHLNKIFQYNNPDLITEILQIELDSIIETLAPSKVIQVKIKDPPFINPDIQAKIKTNNMTLTQAITTNQPDNWHKFRLEQRALTQDIKAAKSEYIKSRLTHSDDKWKFLKQINNNPSQQLPQTIIHNGEVTNSPKSIAKLANDHFIQKIKDIRAGFSKPTCDPMEILRNLIPKCDNNFVLPLITLQQTKDIIGGLKNSNSTGHDKITNKVLKKLKSKIAPHICHMINSIIITKFFPKIFKLTKILPFSKPPKKLENIDSYRPINNLPALEKIFEEWVKINLIEFLQKNKILNENHHGGRTNHSPLTAKAQIDCQLFSSYEQNKISALLATDLSSAFDTIDHKILCQKLEYYGIRGDSLDLIKSYLSNRHQYVEVNSFKSEVKNSLDCSCIQGSKLSGLFYNIYNNEVPVLYKLMSKPIFKKITNLTPQKFNNITHLTVNFVDDSSSVITFKDQSSVKKYLELYYALIHSFYNANKLKINADKTSLLLIHKPKFNDFFKNFSFQADRFKIKPKRFIKILGSYIENGLKLNTEINKLVSCCHNRLNELSKVSKYANFETRLAFVNCQIISKILYMLPTYTNASIYLKNKIKKVVMRSARMIIGSYCFKKSTTYILNKCKWLTVQQLIDFSTVKLVHKIIYNKCPVPLYNCYKLSNRKNAQIHYHYVPKSTAFNDYFIYHGIRLFNMLPDIIKDLPPRKFKKHYKRYLIDPKSVPHDRCVP